MPATRPAPPRKAVVVRRATSFEPVVAAAFGQVVRALRESAGVAQDAFALSAGVDRSYYGKLERGERQPSLGLMLRIAGGLGVSGAELVERTESVIKKLSRTRTASGTARKLSNV